MGVKVKQRPEGSGIWWIFVNHNGKRKAKKIGKDKRTALEAAKKIEARLALGDMNLLNEEEKVKTFGEYATIWISTTVPATCKPSTATDYEGILRNHVLPTFGNVAIRDISRLMIKNLLMEKINSGLSFSKVGHIKSVTSGVLSLAVDDAAISLNPARRLGKIARPKDLKAEINPFTKEELSILLNTFQKHYPRHYPMTLTLARTGMRLGEVQALQWGDLDFNGRFITVQRNITRGKIETPKIHLLRRVDMSKQLKEVLLKLKTYRKPRPLKRAGARYLYGCFHQKQELLLMKTIGEREYFTRHLGKQACGRFAPTISATPT